MADMNKMKEPFSCPSCGERVPFAKVWILNNNSTYRCKKCKTELIPEKMSSLYFVINPIAMIGIGNLLIKKDYSFWVVMSGSLMFGVLGYFITIVCAYKTIRFKVN